MGTLNLAWDNTLVMANANATAQRASKRIKAVGGSFDTSGFSPANDLPKAAITTAATVTDNRIYEFKVSAICTVGGPTDNDNGLFEQIFFACFNPSFVQTFNSVQVTFNLLNKDITKVNVTLRKQSDNTVVATQTVPKIGNSAVANFTGLTASTGYYVDFDLYTIVNAIEVYSGQVPYIGSRCGGNTGGFQITTDAAVSPVTINGGAGAAEGDACSSPLTFYIASPNTDIAPGVQVYASNTLTTPLTGYNFIKGTAGIVFEIDSATGIVGATTTRDCSFNLIVNNGFSSAANEITSVTPAFYAVVDGAFPILNVGTTKGLHAGYSGAITVTVDLGGAASGTLRLYKNGILQECVPVPTSGAYPFAPVVYAAGDLASIVFFDDACGGVGTCEEYMNNTGSPLTGVTYTDCGGTPQNVTVNPGDTICMQPGTGGGNWGFMILLGNC